MPTFIMQTNIQKIDHNLEAELHNEIKSLLSRVIGKSEDFILTVFHQGLSMEFGGKKGNIAYCEIKNVGTLNKSITSELRKALCSLLSDKLQIDPLHTYIDFQESERHLWGWNGKTFA